MMKDTYAFPAQHYDLAEGEHGMTLRDYFAAKAMVAFWLAPDIESCTQTPQAIAHWSYVMADAMLKARSE
jgi:hypothetical protein